MFFLTLHFGLLPFVSSVRASIHFCWTNFSKSWIHAFSFFPCYLPTIALHGWATKDMRSRRWVRKLLDLLMFSNKWINQRILKSYSFLCFHLVYSSSPLGKLRCASSASSQAHCRRDLWVSQAIFLCIVSCMTHAFIIFIFYQPMLQWIYKKTQGFLSYSALKFKHFSPFSYFFISSKFKWCLLSI